MLVGEAAPDILDGGEGEQNPPLPIDVRVQKAENVLESPRLHPASNKKKKVVVKNKINYKVNL